MSRLLCGTQQRPTIAGYEQLARVIGLCRTAAVAAAAARETCRRGAGAEGGGSRWSTGRVQQVQDRSVKQEKSEMGIAARRTPWGVERKTMVNEIKDGYKK